LKIRSCARRSRAAATIFIARVICCVLLTERIRRRMSSRFAMRRADLEVGRCQSEGRHSG
jgi:hypothetical protein